MKTTKKRTPKQPTTKPERNWVDALMISNRKGGTLAERTARLTPTQRDMMIAELRDMSAKNEPTPEVASSDLLAKLMAAGTEFVRRYYPAATQASIHITRYDRQNHEWSVHIPFDCSTTPVTTSDQGATS